MLRDIVSAMSNTRLSVSFSGTLTATAEPLGSESVLAFAAEDNYAAGAWDAGSLQASIQTASYVALPWQAGLVAATIGIQVRSGAPLKIRLTRQLSAQAVIDCDSIAVLTFREADRVTLLEVSGSADLATEFAWLAIGT